ncbi:MAG: PIG-L deacetylase family protein [Acidimicrobiales bacterium]
MPSDDPSTPAAIEPDSPGRALFVAAHPDDIDYGSGATVAWHVSTGWQVSYCLVTDGDAGGYDANVPREQIPVMRRAEQKEAARILGVTDLHWLGYPDGRVEVSLDLRRDISRVIRKVRPDRIVCHNPQRSWDSMYGSHPDHMAAGEATLRAVYPDARNPFAFPELLSEGLEAHVVGEVWVVGGPDPDVVLDLTEFFELKCKALRAHMSQETDRDGHLEPMLRQWMGGTATSHGMPDGRYAEAYRRVETR